jgi:hypothetical protein
MGGYIRPVTGQKLDKHVTAATVTHATGEMGCCLRGPCRGIKKKRNGASSQLSFARETEKIGSESGS